MNRLAQMVTFGSMALLAANAGAQTSKPEPRPTPVPIKPLDKAGLQRGLRRLMLGPAANDGTLAIAVKELGNPEAIFVRRGNKALHPASCVKLVTATAVLRRLGTGARFETRLYGLAAGTTLVTPLYVRGEGDPSVEAEHLQAFAAALAHGFRLSRWRGFSTISNPILFVLHAAYLWLPVGYALLGCAVFGWVFTPTAALHALTMGATGGMVLAVTTRVALGHTGRPLHAARATVMAYWILMLAVLMRVLGPLSENSYMLMIELSAAGWALAFAIFTWVYWPILTRAKLV